MLNVTQLPGGGTEIQIQVCPPTHSTLWWKLGNMREAEPQVYSLSHQQTEGTRGEAISMLCPQPPRHYTQPRNRDEERNASSLAFQPATTRWVRPPSWEHQTAEHSSDLACFLFCSKKFYWNTLYPFTQVFFMAAFM